MKPWEETWRAYQTPEYSDDAGAAEVHDEAILLVASVTQRSDGDLAERERVAFDTARFIAAAPDMARVLLAIEWGHQRGHDGDGACPSCNAHQMRHGCHFDDCELDAALRKAGVR